MTRREFFVGSAAAGLSGPVFADVAAVSSKPTCQDGDVPLLGSAPVLMNPAERSMDVVFAVNGDASGWVDVSMSSDMSNSVRVHSGFGPVMRVNAKWAAVRIQGLRPATRYWYRIGADRVELEKGCMPWHRGAVADDKTYSFTTMGAESEGSFCVINDTHDNKPTVDMVLAKVAELKPSVLIWNGDTRNNHITEDHAIGTFIKPHGNHPAYAAETPVMFVPGNHDYRGRFALHLEDLVPFRDICERSPRYAHLGRNFVERLGDIALIGLDTCEDKQDHNPRMGGIFRMEKYRQQQAQWLAEVIEKPVVKTAKYKVAFCHIPLYDPRPDANPGDVRTNDVDPRYKNDWAAWQRTCANLWGPSFVKAGVQLVITGHQHRFRRDKPLADRPWMQIVGGGPHADPSSKSSYPTVVEGRIADGKLLVRVHNCATNKVVLEETM